MSISSESSAESAAKMSEEPAPVKGPPRNVVTGLIKAARPRQWVKNLLVLIAPVAAFGSDVHYDYREVAVKVSIAFVAFSLAASSVYLVNDARDVEADRAASDQAVPAHRGGRGAGVAGLLHGGGARGRGAGGVLPRDAESGSGDRGLHRHADGLLLRPQTPSGT